MEYRQALAAGTVLAGEYRIAETLRQDGFSITYDAEDLQLKRHVLVKEYFPAEIADRVRLVTVRPKTTRQVGVLSWGRQRFIDEAQTLTKFAHSGIARLIRVIEENNTAYAVIEAEDWPTLLSWTNKLRRQPSQAELDEVAKQLIDSLEVLHEAGVLVRDLSPESVYIRDKRFLTLVDFGTAKSQFAARARKMHAVVRPGYSAPEQYLFDDTQQGPWTDIFSLGAILYRLYTGRSPVEVIHRHNDDSMAKAAASPAKGYRLDFLQAIDRALSLSAADRPQTIKDMRALLFDSRVKGRTAAPAAAAAPTPPPKPAAPPPAPRPVQGPQTDLAPRAAPPVPDVVEPPPAPPPAPMPAPVREPEPAEAAAEPSVAVAASAQPIAKAAVAEGTAAAPPATREPAPAPAAPADRPVEPPAARPRAPAPRPAEAPTPPAAKAAPPPPAAKAAPASPSAAAAAEEKRPAARSPAPAPSVPAASAPPAAQAASPAAARAPDAGTRPAADKAPPPPSAPPAKPQQTRPPAGASASAPPRASGRSIPASAVPRSLLSDKPPEEDRLGFGLDTLPEPDHEPDPPPAPEEGRKPAESPVKSNAAHAEVDAMAHSNRRFTIAVVGIVVGLMAIIGLGLVTLERTLRQERPVTAEEQAERQRVAEQKRLADEERKTLLREVERAQADEARRKADTERQRLRQEADRQAADAEAQRQEAARRAEAETQRQEAAQRAAEAERQRQEAARQAEAERQRQEAAQKSAEAERQRQEAARQAEAERQRQEVAQKAAEAERQRQEAARQAEAERQRQEAARVAEAERQKQLALRQEAERVEAARRAEAERQRQEAERKRVAELEQRLEAERLAERQRKDREDAARRQKEEEQRRQGALRERVVRETSRDSLLALNAQDPTLKGDVEKRLADLGFMRLSTGVGELWRKPGAGEAFRDCATCPQMVVVGAGQFLLGSPAAEAGRQEDEDDTPGPGGNQVRISIPKPFAVGRFEITRGQFAAFVTETGHEMSGGCYVRVDAFELFPDLSWLSPGYPQTDEHPVACVSWLDAQAYAAWLSTKTGRTYRLLSEAEWEYASRGAPLPSLQPRFPFGNADRDLCAFANGADAAAKAVYPGWQVARCNDGHGHTAPVGSFEPNPAGIHDMLGNLWEWVADCYHDSYRGQPSLVRSTGATWAEGCNRDLKVLRGGSWSDQPDSLRAAQRNAIPSDKRIQIGGFRLARSLD